MKRGFLGTTQVDTTTYWTSGKGSQQLKCNETNLYALIDLSQEDANVAQTEIDVQHAYSQMDKYYLCLKAIEFAGSDDVKLLNYGRIIANYDSEGDFNILFSSVSEENIYVDNLIENLRLTGEDPQQTETDNNTFMKWFEEVVVDYNYYQNLDGTRTKKAPRISGLGAIYSDDYYSKKAKESGMSLLYVACTKSNVFDGCTDRSEMQSKLLTQGQIYNWLAGCGTNMTKISVMANIKAGILADTGFKTPDEALDAFKDEAIEEGNKQGTKGMGELITLIISLVLTAVSIIVKLITEILKTKQAEAAARIAQAEAQAINPDLAQYAAPDYPDFSPQMKQMEDMLDDAKSFSAIDLLPVAGMAILAMVGIVFATRKK